MASRWYRYVEGQGLVELGGERDVQPRVYIHEDTMPLTFSHADCKWHNSRSSYRAGVKAAGCEIVGSEINSIKREQKLIGKDGWARAVKETMEKLSSR